MAAGDGGPAGAQVVGEVAERAGHTGPPCLVLAVAAPGQAGHDVVVGSIRVGYDHRLVVPAQHVERVHGRAEFGGHLLEQAQFLPGGQARQLHPVPAAAPFLRSEAFPFREHGAAGLVLGGGAARARRASLKGTACWAM